MTKSHLIAGSLLALSATGCLASKGDIRLLQDELRATRASVARSDSAQRRTSDSLAAALARLAAAQTRGDQTLQQTVQRTNDSLKALSTRTAAADISIKEQLKAQGDDIDQLRELARQTARGAAAMRAQQEQQQAAAAAQSPTTDTIGGTTTAPTPGAPGPATLLQNGKGLVNQNSCNTARRSFQDLLTMYPQSQDAPEALYLIAESYVACTDGNPAKADSVYQLVPERYPKSDFAPTSMYKRAEMLRNAGRNDLARPLYAKVVCEYPKSQVYIQSLDRLGSRPACKP